MNIPLPPQLEGRISLEEAALHLALGLFTGDKVTLGQAADIAGLSQPTFLQELGERRIPVHYGIEELEQDIAAVQEIIGSRRGVNP
jgi:predicted HTH domain antitoxin